MRPTVERIGGQAGGARLAAAGAGRALDFFAVVQERRSVRAYARKAVEEDKLRRVLETVNRAPSAGDLQAYEIVVVTDPEAKAALVRAAHGQGFISQAPLVLVFCANAERSSGQYGRRGALLYCIQDATIAAAYAQLAAVALGLSTVWVGAFEESAVARVVGGLKPVCIMPVGYPAEDASATPRRPLDDLVHSERLRA